MRTFRPGGTRPVILLLCLSAVGVVQATDKLEKGLRFDSPRVLDLSGWSVKFEGSAVPVTALAASEAQKIYGKVAPAGEPGSLKFSDDVYACKDSSTCSQQHERLLVAATKRGVERSGKNLKLVPAQGGPLVFSDWKTPETRNADGDEEVHWYLGQLAGSGYHRVEVQFGHDAPGNFLINLASGKTAFVHNGSDVAEISPDGMHLVTFNADNPPLSIRVAALDAAGPRFELVCAASKDVRNIVPAFSGWRDARSFDITLVVRGANDKPGDRIALRYSLSGAGWTVAGSDGARLRAIGFACKQSR